MGRINGKNLSNGLYSEAVKRAKDGTISASDKNALTQIARQGGLNADEQKFLKGLDVKNNVNLLKQAKSSSAPQSLSFVDPTPANTRLQGATPRAIRNYERMPSALQQKFNQVQDNLGMDRTLMKLLDNGTLTRKDSHGNTILDNVYRMQKGPNQDGVQDKQLAKDTLKVLNDRKEIYQGPHGTCGAASLENVMMRKDPAEMVRIVTNLAAKGRVTTRGGHVLRAGTGSLNWHRNSTTTAGRKDNRSDFDIIFQSAAMRSVALVGGDMDAMGRIADYNVNKDTGGSSAVKTGDSASDPLHLSSLAEDITGQDYDADLRLKWSFSNLATAANAGKEPIALFSPDGVKLTFDGLKPNLEGLELHYVTVTKVENGQVYYYDTAKSNKAQRPSHMAESEFKSKLIATVTVD